MSGAPPQGASALYRNEESGERPVPSLIACAFTAGTVKVISRKNRREVLTRDIHTAGLATSIRPTVNHNQIGTNEKDLSFMIPNADNRVKIGTDFLYNPIEDHSPMRKFPCVN